MLFKRNKESEDEFIDNVCCTGIDFKRLIFGIILKFAYAIIINFFIYPSHKDFRKFGNWWLLLLLDLIIFCVILMFAVQYFQVSKKDYLNDPSFLKRLKYFFIV